MKKVSLSLVCLLLIILIITGCQNSLVNGNNSSETIKENVNPKMTNDPKIQNVTHITIAYTPNSYIADITNKDDIKQFENLFNKAEFTKTDSIMKHPYLVIFFYNKNDAIKSFYIDNDDTIKLNDESYIKSKQISFNNVYSVFNEYATKKK